MGAGGGLFTGAAIVADFCATAGAMIFGGPWTAGLAGAADLAAATGCTGCCSFCGCAGSTAAFARGKGLSTMICFVSGIFALSAAPAGAVLPAGDAVAVDVIFASIFF